ncbi:uncharacterized protein BBA_01740 [Beauveria bassiana ARSEF 2860]|uniref:Uncharacterized protein n=1 Tax=Beauveria bassiana (strain ARSEF 2860) TaxID=655819 RepID=J4WJ05_BEAB2|nr:uncharacterized protein BBA_01740 [Beauveria bassiana ARSEF 2860]EJP69775.1 hypothetical protein BBA_01740 [Beauveria bassiana ARSEF 2860]
MSKLSFYIATSIIFLISVAANDLICITSTAYNLTFQHIRCHPTYNEAAILQKRLCNLRPALLQQLLDDVSSRILIPLATRATRKTRAASKVNEVAAA